MRKFILSVLCLSSFAFSQAAQKTVVIKGGKLLTVSHGTIENGTIVLSGGKITAVGGADVKVPAGAEVIDAKGMTVYPGLIDSETHLGLTEVQADDMTNDLSETSDEIMPQMHVYDAFHAESVLIPVTRYNGITNAIVAPDDKDTLPGQDSFIQLYGRNANEMILGRDVAMPMNFTGAQRRNESFKSAKFPMTRMGLASQMRQAFIDTQEYIRKADENAAKPADKRENLKRDLKLEALVPYLKGQKPVVLEAETGSEFDAAIALAQEFKLKIVLNHLAHAQNVLDEVAALKVPVIVGPIYEQPKDDERYDAVYKLPAELYKRGVKVVFASYDAHQSRNLPYAAGYAVAFGLPYDEALKAITLNAAEVWGVADKLGSLDVGKQANVVIANGDPLDVKTDVKRVFIGGVDVPMVDKQTILRDQYSGK
jgi:imidazolonepropionase-like amidohydrolase